MYRKIISVIIVVLCVIIPCVSCRKSTKETSRTGLIKSYNEDIREQYYQGKRPFKDDVDKFMKLPLQERVEKYVDISLKKPIFTSGKIEDNFLNVRLLTKEIILHGDYIGLKKLEETLNKKGYKSTVYTAIYEMLKKHHIPDKVAATDLFNSWVVKYTQEPFLLQFHPEGVDKLKDILNNKKSHIKDRIDSVQYLVKLNPNGLKAVLKKCEYDNTEIPTKISIAHNHLACNPFKLRVSDTLGGICRVRLMEINKEKIADNIIKYLTSDNLYAVDQMLSFVKSLIETNERNIDIRNIAPNAIVYNDITTKGWKRIAETLGNKLKSDDPMVLIRTSELLVKYFPNVLRNAETLEKLKNAVSRFNTMAERKAQKKEKNEITGIPFGNQVIQIHLSKNRTTDKYIIEYKIKEIDEK